MSYGNTKRRKYVVGFTVHEAREISKDGNAIDPLVIVRACGQEYKTDIKRGKLQHVKFDEEHIWSDIWLSEEEFNMSFIDFELQGACVFQRNEVVGSAKVELAMVRKKRNHIYLQKWLQLTSHAELSGQLLATVWCYGEGDDPPRPGDFNVDPEEEKAHLDSLGNAVIDGSRKGGKAQHIQAYHLYVQVHRAEDLGGAEQVYNPYVTVEFNGHTVATPAASKTHTLNFSECIRIPVTTPLFVDSIIIRVWDKKEWQSHDIIVQGRLSFSLLRTHALQPKWFNFYGFSGKEVTDITQITGQGEVVEENFYRGRLLISGHVAKVRGVQELMRPQTLRGQAFPEPPSSSLTFLADVFEVSGCEGSRAYVTMSIGNITKKTKVAKQADDARNFNFSIEGRGRIPPLTSLVPIDPSNQLELIISVWTKDDGMISSDSFSRVGFVRIKISSIQDWKGEASAPQWISFKPMAHVSSSVAPGAVLLSLHKTSQQVQERPNPSVKPLSFVLRCYMCMARNLESQTSEVCNSFCEVSCAGQTAKTKTMYNTSAPRWSELLTLDLDLPCSLHHSKVYPEPVQVVVYDEVGDTKTLSEKVDAWAGNAQMVASHLQDASQSDNIVGALANKLSNQEEVATKVQRGAKDMFETLQDTVGLLNGDVMSKKRLGAVVNGRQVIGRVQIDVKRLLTPKCASEEPLKPTWVKIKGGMMGAHHVGDVLLAVELMKRKSAVKLPPKPMQPETKRCTLSVSLLGLRNVLVPEGFSELQKPKLEIEVASFGSATNSHTIEWTSKAAIKGKDISGQDDSNRRWNVKGRGFGFEFLKVVHLPVEMPRFAVWEPDVRFRLRDEQNRFVAEGRVSLADHLPWVKPSKAKQQICAGDQYVESSEDEVADADGGVPVSDVDESGGNYTRVLIEQERIGIRFNAEDTKTFMPVVMSVAPGGPARKKGIKAGDWLVAYKKPDDETEKPTGHWTQAQAAAFIKTLDEQKVRPLMLRFRSKEKGEVSVRLIDGMKTGLQLTEDESVKPPEIMDDISADKVWKKQGVGKRWYIVDINGFDTQGMSVGTPAFSKVLALRPIMVTCRPFGNQSGNLADMERKFQQTKPVMLNGVPSAYQKQWEKKVRSCGHALLANTVIPRPTAVLPPVTDSTCLNLWVARHGCLDVLGLVKHVLSGNAEDGGDERSRPVVTGRLEDVLPTPETSMVNVGLFNGTSEVGTLKMYYKVVCPADPNWARKLKDQSDINAVLFDEARFRHRHKKELPALIRVRTYVIRGLNVSGAHTGCGNPFLYFMYGKDRVQLEGHRFTKDTEPRFFRTEERDIKIPEQAIVEVGVKDWQGNAEHELIGRTVLDLEDRWYTEAFQMYMQKKQVPIEYRPLMNEAGSLCKGSLEMWVEMLDAQHAAEVQKSPLFQPPPVEVEMRVVIYTVRNMSLRLCLDKYKEQRERIDVFARCSIDCQRYLGPQPREQETDIHASSQGDAEFNWRCVFSRIAVTRGVPLGCFLQISLWEHFAIDRPQMLCETLVDMKNYCMKVSKNRDMLEIEAEIPLQNSNLTRLLQEELEGGRSDDDEERSENQEEHAGELKAYQAAEESAEIPPAAVVKVLVQVLSQVEASCPEAKVGMKRDEPNRNPVLHFPKSGRAWQDTLPTAVAVVEAVIQSFQSGKRRCKLLIVFLVIAAILGVLFGVKNTSTGCLYIQQACSSTSAAVEDDVPASRRLSAASTSGNCAFLWASC